MNDNIFIEIRHILPEETYAAAELEKSSLLVPWSQSELTLFLKNEHAIYLGAFAGGLLVGICGCYAGAGECSITNIAVSESFRQRNIATRLLRTLLDKAKARGCEKAFLEVADGNMAAIKLYEKFGFKITGRRKGYYKNTDALLMTLEEI